MKEKGAGLDWGPPAGAVEEWEGEETGGAGCGAAATGSPAWATTAHDGSGGEREGKRHDY